MSQTQPQTLDINAMIAAAQAMAAQAAGGAVPAPSSTALVIPPTTGGIVAPAAPAAPVAPGKPMTLEDIDGGSLDVDQWIKVKYYGALIPPDATTFIKEFLVEIDPGKVVPHRALRYTLGKETRYHKSYDNGSRDARSGRSWLQLVAEAKTLDPKCYGDYDSVEVPMTLLAPIVVGDKTLASAGTRLGYTAPATGMKEIRTTWKKAWITHRDEGNLLRGVVRHVAKDENGNQWGYLTFGNPTEWTPVQPQ